MKSVSKKFVVLAALAGLGMSFSGPPYVKLDVAKATAQQTGMLIAVYATVNYKAESC